MLIAQLSDPHFMPENVRLFGRLDTAGYLKRAVEHLNALGPDVVLITGDLTNDGDEQVYAAFADIVAALHAPFFVLTGNHDDREIMRAWFADHLPGSGPLCYVIDSFSVRLIALDTLVAGEPWGRLGPEQLEWLDARLLEMPERPTVVALHHPPFRTGIGHLDRSMLRDADALAAVVGRHPQVERVVCGHVHRAIQCRFAGTLAQSAPSCAHQAELILDLRAAGGPAALVGPGGWAREPPQHDRRLRAAPRIQRPAHRGASGLAVVARQEEVPDRVGGGADRQPEPDPARLLPALEADPGEAEQRGHHAAIERLQPGMRLHGTDRSIAPGQEPRRCMARTRGAVVLSPPGLTGGQTGCPGQAGA
jgi:hypothetical protein